jgi:hypothetical protein
MLIKKLVKQKTLIEAMSLKALPIFMIAVLVSCTSNTIYKKPKDLIPKDVMIDMLTDMYIANAGRSHKNVNEMRNLEYISLVYDKYRIDSARFNRSNVYYMSKIDEYEQMHEKVKERVEKMIKDRRPEIDKDMKLDTLIKKKSPL